MHHHICKQLHLYGENLFPNAEYRVLKNSSGADQEPPQQPERKLKATRCRLYI